MEHIWKAFQSFRAFASFSLPFHYCLAKVTEGQHRLIREHKSCSDPDAWKVVHIQYYVIIARGLLLPSKLQCLH